MFTYGGENRFSDRFDFFEWSAPYYETPEEVCRQLNEMDLCGKRLKAINAIGAFRHMGHSRERSMYETIRAAGIELEQNWWETYEHIDDVQVPWNVFLCEPVQFVFEDDSTLEIFLFDNGGARIGKNTIPAGMIDGLNQGSLDANRYFEEFIGKTLRGIGLKVQTNEVKHIEYRYLDKEKPYTESHSEYVIEFAFEYPYKLKLIHNWDGWYEVKAEGSSWEKTIPYKRTKEVCLPKEREEVDIISGHDSGGTFWIFGTSSDESKKPVIANLGCFGMSIDDTKVHTYLSVFLYSYFDESIQNRGEYEEPYFDWYGGNRYTFENMRRMLELIRFAMELIRDDFDNPALDDIKANWGPYRYTEKTRAELSDKELNDLRRLMIPEALDFYERFCTRVEHMLKLPGCDIMMFVGP